jgi:hypothetical protein
MMEHRSKLESVERLLAETHLRRHAAPVGKDWAHGIMRVVRQDDRYSPTLAWAAPVVWRAAAGAALIAVVFAGSVVALTSRQPEPVTAAWLEEFDAGPPLIE